MKPTRKFTRRSFFLTVAGGAAAGAGTLVSGNAAAMQRQCTGQTDSDSGATRDPIGCGTGGRPPSLNQGGAQGQTGITDTDLGPGSDPVGRGRGGNRARPPRAGVTDGDSGPNADRAQAGRETPRMRAEACSLARFNLAHVEREISETWNDEQMMQAQQALARLRTLAQQQREAYFGVAQYWEARSIMAAFGRPDCGPNDMGNVTNCSSLFGGVIQGQIGLRGRLASNQLARQNYLEQIARYCG